MQKDITQPSPQRFEVFTELANGKGFRIKSSKYIYMFDKYGGWYDEFDNYYNPDGESEDPPEDQDQDFERVILDNGDDEQDEFEREYGGKLGQLSLHQGSAGFDSDKGQHLQKQSQKKSYERETKPNVKGKKYISKASFSSKHQKTEQKKGQQQRKDQEKKKNQKTQHFEQTWSNYLVEVTKFPQKVSFTDWLKKQHKLQQNQHYRNLQKVPQPEGSAKRVAKVELRGDVLDRVQNSKYQNTTVYFQRAAGE